MAASSRTASPSGLTCRAWAAQAGFAARSRWSSSSRGVRSPQPRQMTRLRLPCSSTTSRAPAAWCSPSTFWVMIAAEQAAALHLGHGLVAVVGSGPGDVPPAQVAARPVPLPGRGGAGERLVGHGLGPPGQAGRAAVVGDAGFGGQPRPAQHDDPAAPEQTRNFPNGIRRRPNQADGPLGRTLRFSGGLCHHVPMAAADCPGGDPPGPPARRCAPNAGSASTRLRRAPPPRRAAQARPQATQPPGHPLAGGSRGVAPPD